MPSYFKYHLHENSETANSGEGAQKKGKDILVLNLIIFSKYFFGNGKMTYKTKK